MVGLQCGRGKAKLFLLKERICFASALFCSKCNQHFALYQKDGHGRLLRMYLDRIFAPQELALLESKVNSKTDMPNLKCPKCGALIGTPMVYEAERRLAFRLIYGSFVKRKKGGVYPSQQPKNTHKPEKGGSDEQQNEPDF